MPLSPALLPCCLSGLALVLIEGCAEVVALADDDVVAVEDAEVRELGLCVVEINVVADFELVVALGRISEF
ncbi:uncharacterized protein MYCFIDRAFT_201994 [Pseudocercospora fijiensis CIRAD86]|uniref:Secreted protein n=1 Tax=Pseudocercospora fijiensis (strain CIRAD86) TaxID=383855 RepID=N1QBN8_PSEFD|nr:uncharacterized protein MYCFIDRAFT_201994 [Pseudocercospora fijiensis CIRAD86]EME89576.1 hypothetical protein MYCFIDRAFT_201994 [Pseudocercospora fijiensis CIRAD86]